MFLNQCNYPGCNEHAMFKVPNVDWNCGRHVPVKRKGSYLPSQHPGRKKFNYGKHESKD